MNNLKKYMLTLALLIPANSVFAISFPSWDGIKDTSSLCYHYAYSNGAKGANAVIQAGKSSFNYVKGNGTAQIALALGTLGTTGFAAAYKYNKNFKDAVNNKATQVKDFAKNKFNSLKDRYNKVDKAKKAKYAKIAAVTGVAAAGGYFAYPKVKGLFNQFFAKNSNN